MGAITFGFLGILGGKKGIKYGAIGGAALGGLGLGRLAAKKSWRDTSNESVDEANRREEERRKNNQLIESYIKTGSPRVFNALNNAKKKIQDYVNLEVKHNIRFGSDIYKLISLQEKFINIAVSWMKNLKNPSSIYRWYEFIWPVLEAPDTEVEIINYKELDSHSIIFMTDIPQDNWITYCPENGKYGFDVFGKNKNTLKEVLLKSLSGQIDSIDDEFYVSSLISEEEHEDITKLIKLYANFIKQNL